MKNIIWVVLFSTSVFAQQPAIKKQIKICPSLQETGNVIYQDLNQVRPQIKIKATVKIAVIDTGIDYNNSELRKKIWMPNQKITESNFGLNLIGNDRKPQDTHGHGTHVIGTILSLFPAVKIFPIKYYSEKATGQQNLDNLIKGMRAAIAAKVDIINISAGGPEASFEELEVIKEAKRNNILIISAAGNEGYELSAKKTYFPAQYAEENILSVLNLNKQGLRHKSSNYGKEIEVGTLGTIYSYGLNSCAQRLVGTSQATAVVSAFAAMIKASNPGLSYKELKAKVLENTIASPSSHRMISFSKLGETSIPKNDSVSPSEYLLTKLVELTE